MTGFNKEQFKRQYIFFPKWIEYVVIYWIYIGFLAFSWFFIRQFHYYQNREL